MFFDSTFHQKIREMLIGKYGKTYESTATLYTAVNQYHNTVSQWMFREGSLVLTGMLPTNTGILQFHPYTVTEASQDPGAIELRMLGKRTF